MTAPDVLGLPRGRMLTRGDLGAMPDDGHRYELIDGTLVVTPSPAWMHQRAVLRLSTLLHAACPEQLEVLPAPFDVVLADDTVVQPDILVARQADLTERGLLGAPLLAVEVLSPSTRHLDLAFKRARYEVAGCQSYWVIDPDRASITAWSLRDGVYEEVGSSSGAEELRLTLPYPITLSAASLISS